MSNKILEGMARAHYLGATEDDEFFSFDEGNLGGPQAALLWLADNVSSEMILASKAAQTVVIESGGDTNAIHLACISAALRAAAAVFVVFWPIIFAWMIWFYLFER